MKGPQLKVVVGDADAVSLPSAQTPEAVGKPLRILVYASADERGREIRDALVRRPVHDELRRGRGDLAALAGIAERAVPEVLVLEGFDRNAALLPSVEQFALRNPQVAVVLVTESLSTDFLMAAMRVGVREIVPAQGLPNALFEAVDRLRRRSTATATTRPPGKILAFVSSKGGGGATFLASNLGYSFAADEKKKVLLVDLNLPFGEAEIYVSDRRAAHSIADVAHEIDRLDAALLESVVLTVAPGFAILATPEEPERAIDVKPEHVEQILNVAASVYDYVLLDVNGSLDATTVQALDRADEVYVVMQDTLPYVRSARRLQGVFRNLGYGSSKVKFVINRHDPRSEIGQSAIERTLGLKVAYTIPNSFRTVSAAVNRGVPAVQLNHKDPVAKAIAQMSKALAAAHAPRVQKSQ